ncbi:hypothetical protein GOODEAATRI_029473 [Goodea atripinnis]|uniref:Uncharacterized protein n=1 Tax=Goodea atripinnis TaxID=208336 RepID=A0ABV0MWF7_9TELE
MWETLCLPSPDVIRRTGSIQGRSVSHTGSRIAARRSTPPQVLHGAQSSNVQLTHLGTGETLYKLVFLASCCNGSFYIADTRTSAAPQVSPAPSGESVLWWTDASAAPQQACCKVVRLSSSGQALVSDLRNLGGTVCKAQLGIQTPPCKLEDVTVLWAPALDGCFSVSGQFMQTLKIL